MRSTTLRYIDGDYKIVLAPPTLRTRTIRSGGVEQSVTEPHSKLVRLHHLELQKAIAGRPVWAEPIAPLAEKLFAEFGSYYRKVADLLDIDVSRVESVDRHHFFICTEPIEVNGQQVPGLSLLEQLMGYSYPSGEAKEEKPAEPAPTTNDFDVDVVVSLCLSLKRQAIDLLHVFSPEDAALAVRQTNELLKRAHDQAKQDENKETGDDVVEEVEDDPEFIAKRDRIYGQLQKLGIWMPDGF